MSRSFEKWCGILLVPASVVVGILFIISGIADAHATGLSIAGAILIGAVIIATARRSDAA